MFLLCKTETFKKFQRTRNNYEITHRWEASGTDKSMNWLFSSLFFLEHTWVFQCCFSIFLHTTYITWLPWNFFFLLQQFFCFVHFFYALASCSHFFVFLISNSWGDQISLPHVFLDASHSTESSSFVDCSPQLCGPGQEAGWITKYTMWL